MIISRKAIPRRTVLRGMGAMIALPLLDSMVPALSVLSGMSVSDLLDQVEVLKLLDGIVDVYLPDLKYAGDDQGFLYSKVRGYREVARPAIVEMYRQMGDKLVYAGGLLKRGLVIRLLVLPNDVGGVRESLQWIHDELSPRVAVSLMAQYYPIHRALANPRYAALSRSITAGGWGPIWFMKRDCPTTHLDLFSWIALSRSARNQSSSGVPS